MNILIYGGHSPIAWGTAELLASRGNRVGLVTRRVDDEVSVWCERMGVSAIESTIGVRGHTKSAVEIWADQEIDIDSVAFFHKFRGEAGDESSQFEIEVLSPSVILRQWVEGFNGDVGRALLVSSPAARSFVSDQPFYYHATKAAVNALVRWGAVEYGPSGVCVNGLVPGSAVFKDRAALYYENNSRLVSLYNEVIPVGKMTQVRDLAVVASFLLESCPLALTGQILDVDGGVSQRDQIGLARLVADL